MTNRIKRLSAKTQRSLSLAAAIGNVFDLHVLSYISKSSIHETLESIRPAIMDELVHPISEESAIIFNNVELRDDTDKLTLGFLHDRIQQAAYELTPEEDRASVHLTIGRNLLQVTPPQLLEDHLFDILSHFKVSIHLLVEPVERLQMAEIWVRAARRAKKSNAVYVGSEYASYAMRMLPEGHWDTHYELSLDAYRLRVICEHLCGRAEEAEHLYPIMLSKCKTLADTTSIYQVKIQQLEAQQKFGEAMSAAIECLKFYGVHVPNFDISDEQLQICLTEENNLIEKHMLGKQVSELYNAPDMSNDADRDVLSILTSIWACTYCLTRKDYMALVSTISLNWTLLKGISDRSSAAMTNWAFSAVDGFHDPRLAFDMGVLGCSLLESHPNEPIRNRCYFTFSVGVSNKVIPLIQYIYPIYDTL